jgi:hypothetical protein
MDMESHGRDEKCIQNVIRKSEGRRPLGYLGIDERIILY